jgi:hypothetical protein
MRAIVLGATLLVAGVLGCSLLVDTSELDAGCPTGQRLCDGKCVSDTDPAYGCTPGECGPPCTKTNAIPHCVNGACEVKACRFGFGCRPACNEDVLTSEAHCGSCGNGCERWERCVAGTCVAQPTTTRAPAD